MLIEHAERTNTGSVVCVIHPCFFLSTLIHLSSSVSTRFVRPLVPTPGHNFPTMSLSYREGIAAGSRLSANLHAPQLSHRYASVPPSTDHHASALAAHGQGAPRRRCPTRIPHAPRARQLLQGRLLACQRRCMHCLRTLRCGVPRGEAALVHALRPPCLHRFQ